MTLTSFFALFWQRSQENKLTQAAGSLTYSTMLAIVPLIMVVFSIFSAFPVFNEVTGALKEFIFTNFAPSASDVVGQYIDEFVRNSKQMSAVGIVSLILVALMLINSIDRTLNGIWQDTSKNRFGNISVSKGSLNNIYNLLVQNKYVGLFYIPKPEKGIMKFKNIAEFEEQVIEKLVQKETKDYYYKMKKNANKSNNKYSEHGNNEQLSLFG